MEREERTTVGGEVQDGEAAVASTRHPSDFLVPFDGDFIHYGVHTKAGLLVGADESWKVYSSSCDDYRRQSLATGKNDLELHKVADLRADLRSGRCALVRATGKVWFFPPN